MRQHLRPDPLGVPRNPLAIYLLLLSCLGGLLQIIGLTTAASVERELPGPVALVWACILFGGSTITLVGMFWQGDVRAGLLMKRTGMFALGVAAIVYAVVLLGAVGFGATIASGAIFGFGVACFMQFRNVNHRIEAIILKTKDEAEER